MAGENETTGDDSKIIYFEPFPLEQAKLPAVLSEQVGHKQSCGKGLSGPTGARARSFLLICPY